MDKEKRHLTASLSLSLSHVTSKGKLVVDPLLFALFQSPRTISGVLPSVPFGVGDVQTFITLESSSIVPETESLCVKSFNNSF